MPIVFYISREFIRRVKKDKAFELSPLKMAVGVIYFAVLFELVLPLFNERYIGDWLDVIMYVVGGVLYFFLSTVKPSESFEISEGE